MRKVKSRPQLVGLIRKIYAPIRDSMASEDESANDNEVSAKNTRFNGKFLLTPKWVEKMRLGKIQLTKRGYVVDVPIKDVFRFLESPTKEIIEETLGGRSCKVCLDADLDARHLVQNEFQHKRMVTKKLRGLRKKNRQ